MQTLIHNIFSKKVGSGEGDDAPRRGALILHGNELKTYNDQEIHKIISKIANSVRLCPRFFLVIEEFLEAPKLVCFSLLFLSLSLSLILILIFLFQMLDFLDILSSSEYCPPEMIHQCISTAKMTIILLSDLGPMTSKEEAEQIQKGTLEKDVYLDIINQRKDAARLAEQPLSIYFKRMPYVSPSDLNIHTVPESIVHIIHVLLESKSSVSSFGNIKSLNIVFPSEDGLKRLAVELYKKVIEDDSLIIRNFRAIDQVFDSDFFPVVIDALVKLPLNTIHVTVSCSFDETLQCTAYKASQRVSNEP